MPSWAVRFDLSVDVSAPDIIACAARSEALAAVIRNIPIPPAVQMKIDALNILRAVQGTTGIEGIELSEDEVERVLEAAPGERALSPGREREEKEVRNAANVMRYVADLVRSSPATPMTEELICHIHELTTEGIDYENNVPGRYRHHSARAGTYVPPRTAAEIQRLMAEFIEWFNLGQASQWPPAVRAIAAHFYVVSIHPFGDGNGRTARAVEAFLLFKGGINARGFYSLANYYYRNRDGDYIRLLDHVRFETQGDLTPFVRFGLRGLVEELEGVHKAVIDEVRIISFRDYARERLMEHGRLGTKTGERMYHFLLGLAGEPSVSLRALRRGSHWLSQHYQGVTGKTLSRDLNFLRVHELVVVDGDEIRANLGVMDAFLS